MSEIPKAALVASAVAALLHAPAAEACRTRDSETQVFGVPVWATDPNEGDTWGAMPVLIGVCDENQRTQWIFAPSVTWNSIIHYTGTLRLYVYPDLETQWSVLASVSTHENYRLVAIWQRLPLATGAWTSEANLRVERTIFARFFGLGPETRQNAESSFTLSRAVVSGRSGLNVGGHINLGALGSLEQDGVDDIGVDNLPLAPEMFPNVPGMHGASLASQGLELRYDDRVGGDFARSGTFAAVRGEVVEGISSSPNYLRFGARAHTLWPELDWLSGAARVEWDAVSSTDVPFYQQSQLGGAFLMRGYAEGRFTDRQAWTIESEQRIRLASSHWFGVTTDWRLDPFVTAGQVFGALSNAISRPQLAAGVGVRALVRPNVLGRIDVAEGGDGLKVYVEIGYPY